MQKRSEQIREGEHEWIWHLWDDTEILTHSMWHNYGDMMNVRPLFEFYVGVVRVPVQSIISSQLWFYGHPNVFATRGVDLVCIA